MLEALSHFGRQRSDPKMTAGWATTAGALSVSIPVVLGPSRVVVGSGRRTVASGAAAVGSESTSENAFVGFLMPEVIFGARGRIPK